MVVSSEHAKSSSQSPSPTATNSIRSSQHQFISTARRDERFRVAEESRARRADAVAQIKEVVGYDVTDYLGADPVALLQFAEEYREKKSAK